MALAPLSYKNKIKRYTEQTRQHNKTDISYQVVKIGSEQRIFSTHGKRDQIFNSGCPREK